MGQVKIRQIDFEDIQVIQNELPEKVVFTFMKRGVNYFHPQQIKILLDDGYDINAIAQEKLGKTIDEVGRFPDKLPRIYDLVLPELIGKHFHNINYKTELETKLVGKPTFENGSLVLMEWFCMEPSEQLILKAEFNYEFDSTTHMYSKRTETRTWLNGDGSENAEKKIGVKDYTVDKVAQFQASKRRRENIVYEMYKFIIQCLIGNGVATDEKTAIAIGSGLVDSYITEIESFKTTPDLMKLPNRLSAETYETTQFQWLFDTIPGTDTPIRDRLITIINS